MLYKNCDTSIYIKYVCRFRLDTRKKFFTMMVVRPEKLCPLHGRVQGQVGWDF